MTRSWKRDAARAEAARWDAEHPDVAAQRAAEQFERAAIPIPACLLHDDSVKPWLARQLDDAAVLYRNLVMAGDEGLLLRDMPGSSGQGRDANALRALRRSGAVTASSERGRDSAGRSRDLIRLRAR